MLFLLVHLKYCIVCDQLHWYQDVEITSLKTTC